MTGIVNFEIQNEIYSGKYIIAQTCSFKQDATPTGYVTGKDINSA
jgi:hypothetical protein